MTEPRRPPNRIDRLTAGAVFAERYEILGELGAGGMGRVYRARHVGLAKQVALKVLGPPSGRAPDFEARFAREARALARLDHPGCVRVLDHGRSYSTGRSYLAMELLAGPTLGAVLARGPLAPGHAVALARQILHALAHAHGHGVIHRDLKPDNVMLVQRRTRAATEPGVGVRGLRPDPRRATPEPPSLAGARAVLIDFGLASVADEQPLTAVGMCVGSPSYLAPERLLGKPHDARTDLYAVGVILYEMLAGEKPFVGATPEAVMQLALHRPPRPLRAVRPDVPRPLERVVSRALAKDPERRFTDAEEMLLALADADDELARGEVRRDENERADDTAATVSFVALALRAPSRWARAWAWLRFGAWRWRRA